MRGHTGQTGDLRQHDKGHAGGQGSSAQNLLCVAIGEEEEMDSTHWLPTTPHNTLQEIHRHNMSRVATIITNK